MIQRIKCFFGFHSWIIPDNDKLLLKLKVYDTNEADYIARCRHCDDLGLIIYKRTKLGSIDIIEFDFK